MRKNKIITGEMMALDFDITREPPALSDIALEREQATQGLAVLRKKDFGFLIFAIIAVPSIVSFQLFVAIPVLRDPMTEPTLVGIIALYTPYIFGVIFFVTLTANFKVVEKPRKILRTTLTGLEEADSEKLSEVAGSEHQHSEIASYLEKVAAQGRPLVNAEVDAILRWLDKHKPKPVE
jgi:hypothetical protein